MQKGSCQIESEDRRGSTAAVVLAQVYNPNLGLPEGLLHPQYDSSAYISCLIAVGSPETDRQINMVNKAAAKLRAQLAKEGKVIVCPGVQDGLSARVCLDEGFENLYMVEFSQDENPRFGDRGLTQL